MWYVYVDSEDNITGFGGCPILNEDYKCFGISEGVKNNLETKGTNYYIYQEGTLVLNPNYESEEAVKREEMFKKFFFKIDNFGWYRKQPKGYTSALESLSIAYNMITSGLIQELPAGTFIFYQEPDFFNPETLKEEWLVNHQIRSTAMTKEQFVQFYVTFVMAWNQIEH